jgi:hypothetical protein
MNGNIDSSSIINYLKLYLRDVEIELALDIIQELDYKIKNKK